MGMGSEESSTPCPFHHLSLMGRTSRQLGVRYDQHEGFDLSKPRFGGRGQCVRESLTFWESDIP